MDLTAIAAFVAAGLSLVNVGISANLRRRRELHQWRRDTELPIVARIMRRSDDAKALWDAADEARNKWIGSAGRDNPDEDVEAREEAHRAWVSGSAVLEEAQFEVSQLDLIAGTQLRDAAANLVACHESWVHWFRPASGADGIPHTEQTGQLHARVQALIAAARADLGVERARIPLSKIRHLL